MKTSNFIEWYEYRFAMEHIAHVDNVYHINYPKYNVIYMLYAPNVFHFDEVFCNAIDLSVNHCKATECIVQINHFCDISNSYLTCHFHLSCKVNASSSMKITVIVAKYYLDSVFVNPVLK